MRVLAATVLVAATVIAQVAVADEGPQGLRFDKLPVGCAIHERYGGDDRRVTVYVGRNGKKHITRTYVEPVKGKAPSRLIVTITHDAAGRMIRKDWAGGDWETYTPYSCFALPGQCRYRYRNGDGDNRFIVGKVTKRGGNYLSEGGFEGEAPFPPTVFTLGPFNEMTSFAEGSTQFKVTRYENCGGTGS